MSFLNLHDSSYLRGSLVDHLVTCVKWRFLASRAIIPSIKRFITLLENFSLKEINYCTSVNLYYNSKVITCLLKIVFFWFNGAMDILSHYHTRHMYVIKTNSELVDGDNETDAPFHYSNFMTTYLHTEQEWHDGVGHQMYFETSEKMWTKKMAK